MCDCIDGPGRGTREPAAKPCRTRQERANARRRYSYEARVRLRNGNSLASAHRVARHLCEQFVLGGSRLRPLPRRKGLAWQVPADEFFSASGIRIRYIEKGTARMDTGRAARNRRSGGGARKRRALPKSKNTTFVVLLLIAPAVRMPTHTVSNRRTARRRTKGGRRTCRAQRGSSLDNVFARKAGLRRPSRVGIFERRWHSPTK